MRWLPVIFLFLSLAGVAQPLGGTVYGVYPEGVMLQQGGYGYLVPVEHASFEIGGLRASWTSLLPGQSVTAIVPPSYFPGVQRIPDPYAWKMRYHPGHPHGGPPGLRKQEGSPGGGPPPGQGKGRGKGK